MTSYRLTKNVLLTAAMAVIATAFNPHQAESDPVKVRLYEHSKFKGRTLDVTADVANLADRNFSDILSSIRLEGVAKVALFSDADYQGACHVFRKDDEDFGNNCLGHDTVSSLRLNADCPSVAKPGRITVFNGSPAVARYRLHLNEKKGEWKSLSAGKSKVEELKSDAACVKIEGEIAGFTGWDNVCSYWALDGETVKNLSFKTNSKLNTGCSWK